MPDAGEIIARKASNLVGLAKPAGGSDEHLHLGLSKLSTKFIQSLSKKLFSLHKKDGIYKFRLLYLC